MDLESQAKWVGYSSAKDEMFNHADIKQAPCFVVRADDKKRARLNVIAHLLSQIQYDELEDPLFKLPRRQKKRRVHWGPISDQTFVPEVF